MNVEPRFLTGEGPQIFTGNEALLKGALEAEGGVNYLGGYPGSPIAGFFDAFAVIKDLLNEKGIRAVINNNEALAAASLNGTQTMPLRAMIVFKSVGVHVAADALALASLADAQRVLRYYIRRWECEEGMQFLKEQVNLESIRTFRWSAICRLVLLCVLVMIYLAWLIEEHPRLTDRLIEYGQVLPDEGDFLFYRLLTGVTEAINVCFYLRRDLL